MPVISTFYGLVIAMYYLDNKQHHLPHVHVRYGETEAIFEIPNGICLEGKLPSKEKLIIAWIELRRDELMKNWNLAVAGNSIFKISPLK